MLMKKKDNPIVEIKPDMKVSLDIPHKNEGVTNVLTLNSIVEEVSTDGRILIQMPTHQGYYYPLPRDNPFLMHFFVDAQMYAVFVQFEERITREHLMFAKVRRFGKITPHQRRDCYRFPCSLPVTIDGFWQSEQEKYPELKSTEGQIIDFSDGGMLFFTYEDIEKGKKITLTFDMGKVETIEAMVLRSHRVENGKYKLRVAVQFLHSNKDKAQKSRFYKYIVEKQMEERRKLLQDNKPQQI